MGLPLFVIGGLCLAAGLFLFLRGSALGLGGGGAFYLRLWFIYLALGSVAVLIALLAVSMSGSATEPDRPPSDLERSRREEEPPNEPRSSAVRPPPSYVERPAPAPTVSPVAASVPPAPALGGAGRERSAHGIPPAPPTPAPEPPWTGTPWDAADATGEEPSEVDEELFDELPDEGSTPEGAMLELDELEASLKARPGSRPAP